MKHRWILLFGVALLVAPATAQHARSTRPAATAQRQHGRWAQDYVGRTADPDVRFGQLANGMRYAIMRNDTPKGAVSMRMLVGSGSLSEREEERGLAHFLEHMAFRGSTNVADGEVVRMLERHGLRFGADTNAGTNFDATTYQFDFPQADAASIDTGLLLFREIGGRLKIDQAAVEAERGVVLSEERLRDSANLKATEVQLGMTLAGTNVAERFPIGTVASLNAATAARIRRFYEANYRPENTTIVIVGAVDPVAIEAQLKQRFGDWHGVGPADPHLVSVPHIGTAHAKSFSAPGASDSLSLTWTRPLDMRADTEEREHDHAMRFIGLTVLNLRLREEAQAPGAPFSAAGADARDMLGTAEQTTINILPTPGHQGDALRTVIAAQRRLLRDGITAADIARTIALLRPQFRAAADAAATRSDAQIANLLVYDANNDELPTNPAQDLVAFDKIAPLATPAAVTEAYRNAFGGAGPLAFQSSSDTKSADDTALAATLAAASTAPLAASSARAAIAWPYAGFGAPGHVVDRATDATGVTTVSFANGTRLAVKPTKFVAGGVSVQVSFGSGIVGLRPDQARARWLLAFGGPAFLQGGTTKLDWEQMQRALEGHNVGIALAPGDMRFVLGADTRSNELAFETQLLAAYFADAAYRPDGVVRLQGQIMTQLAAIDSNSQAVFSRAIGPLTHNGDARWKDLPDASDIAATTPADLAPLLRDALNTPVDIVMAGDVTVDDAIAAVAPTFAALPAATRPRAGRYTQRVVPVAPGSAPVVVTHHGRADQAEIVQLWATPDYYAAPGDADALDVARGLLSDRLIDTVREKLGLTYSPFVAAEQDLDLPGQGYFLAGTEIPPDRFDQFRQLVGAELATLASKPIDADAFARAKGPILEARKKAMETNGYWAGRLSRLLIDPRATAYYRDEVARIERVTPADVQRVLNLYVVGKSPLSIEVRPAVK